MTDYHEQCDGDNKIILLDLVKDAPSDSVKTVIQHFDVDKNGDEIYKQMIKSPKPPIVATAEYLKINSSQVKEKLIRDIIKKINSLLLEYCNKCTTYYSAKLVDTPVAVCECGQFCHEPCYSDAKEVFLNFPGIVFRCSRCLTNSTNNENTKPTSSLQHDTESESKTPVVEPSGDDEMKPTDLNNEPKKTFILKVTNAFNLDLLQTLYPQSTPYAICEKYKRNNCPHGRDGKTEIDGEPCSNLHPKKCFAWCKAGNDRRFGCNKGQDCSYYHPVICRNSIRYRRCLTTECTFTHLKFTKRYKEKTPPRDLLRSDHFTPWSNQVNNNTNMAQPDTLTNPPVHVNSHHNIQTPENHNRGTPRSDLSFLVELIQSMKQDMQNVKSEVREFKQNVTTQVSNIHPQVWSQSPAIPTSQHVQIDQSSAVNQVHQNQQSAPVNHVQQNQPSHPEQGSHLQHPHQMILPQHWNLLRQT